MQLPRRAILIRIVLWGGLIGFFGYEAIQAHRDKQATADALEGNDLPAAQTVQLPDGTKVQMYEMTESEFEKKFGHKPPTAASPEASAPESAVEPPPSESDPNDAEK